LGSRIAANARAPAFDRSLALLDCAAGLTTTRPARHDRREACAVIRDWLTEAESALVRGDLKRHFECLQEGLDVLTSLRGLEQ
jgi:hypothetical protein